MQLCWLFPATMDVFYLCVLPKEKLKGERERAQTPTRRNNSKTAVRNTRDGCSKQHALEW